MIRTARATDVPQLKKIWQVCFGDSEAYIDFFLRGAFRPEYTLLWEEEGCICSMFFLLDSVLMIEGREYPAFYLYAAATLPEYRGRGLMGKLLQYAEGFCRERKRDYIVLVPAEKHLFSYYRKFGYREQLFAAKEIRCGRPQCVKGKRTHTQVDFSALEQIRRSAISACGGMLWRGKGFQYALDEHLYTGGNIFQTDVGYVLYHISGDVCRVDEMIAGPGQEEMMWDKFLCGVPAERYEVLRPCWNPTDGLVPRGMVLSLGTGLPEKATSHSIPYIGLTLG